ncbi:MAG: hypothetical protein WCY19_05155 [Candidatus Gastranaerophilaceae bacterium]
MIVTQEEFFNTVKRTRAHEIAEKIRGDYDGYKLFCRHEDKNSTIFFQTKSLFGKDKRIKDIGTLCYNAEKDIITYFKYGFVESAHKYNKTDSIGICWDILRRLSAAGDQILIAERGQFKQIKKYSISVCKALRMATPENFKHFQQQGFEKQVLIPKSEFKEIEGKGVKK